MRATEGMQYSKVKKGTSFRIIREEGKPTNIIIGDNCPKDLYKLSITCIFMERTVRISHKIIEYTNHSSLSDDSFTLYQGIEN